MYAAFCASLGDAMTQDASALAGPMTAAPNPAQYAVLLKTIGKEPLGAFVRNGDDVWAKIITTIHYGLIEAGEAGVTQASPSTDAKLQCLLGQTGEFCRHLGLDNPFMLNAIRATSNYGQVSERNVGQGSPLELALGLNGLWDRGGLM